MHAVPRGCLLRVPGDCCVLLGGEERISVGTAYGKEQSKAQRVKEIDAKSRAQTEALKDPEGIPGKGVRKHCRQISQATICLDFLFQYQSPSE